MRVHVPGCKKEAQRPIALSACEHDDAIIFLRFELNLVELIFFGPVFR